MFGCKPVRRVGLQHTWLDRDWSARRRIYGRADKAAIRAAPAQRSTAHRLEVWNSPVGR